MGHTQAHKILALIELCRASAIHGDAEELAEP
jgi:hypothetical protein